MAGVLSRLRLLGLCAYEKGFFFQKKGGSNWLIRD